MKIQPGWILFIGRRYFRSKREGRHVTPSKISIGGIAVGVTALIAVMSVMNGLQLGFIEDILEIQSYHLRIRMPDSGSRLPIHRIASLPEVKSATLFRDTQTLVQGEFSDYQSVMVRGVERESALGDKGLMDHLELMEGTFLPEGGDIPGVVIGNQLARRLGIRTGDLLQMVSMSGSSFARLRPKNNPFIVTGIFRSGYYQYDSAFCFVGLENIGEIDTTAGDLTLGIKLKNRFQDRKIQARIEGILKNEGSSGEVVSWRVYNRAFFGALRMEKLTMTALLTFIFLVVGVNIKNSLERSVMEKREDVGILRAVGAAPSSVRAVFIFEGWIIGVLGTLIGLPVGMLLSININHVFRGVELLMNKTVDLISLFSAPVAGGGEIRIFSPTTFYLQEVPVRIMPGDVFGIAIFAVAVAVFAAYSASRRIAEFKPVEILRNE